MTMCFPCKGKGKKFLGECEVCVTDDLKQRIKKARARGRELAVIADLLKKNKLRSWDRKTLAEALAQLAAAVKIC